MKAETLFRIKKILEKIEKCNTFVILLVVVMSCFPFYVLYEAYKYIVRCIDRKRKGLVYDQLYDEWVTKEKYAARVYKKKIEDREEPLVVKYHVTTDKDDVFFFFGKRKLVIPYDQLVYVETEYNEKLHQFFTDNAEWLEAWQKWHGWEIAEYDYEDIKEGMFYPEDFAVFRHGFLWHSPMSSGDNASGLSGSIHYYYEIDPDSAVPIKEQMEQFMRKIYHVIDWG